MTALSGALEDYLVLRRSMGFKLERAEKLLRQFVAYCETVDAEVLTADLALKWATLPEGASRGCPEPCGISVTVPQLFRRQPDRTWWV